MAGFLRILSSTLAAFFGVQSETNRQQDFSAKSPVPYILMGLLLAACMVLGLIWVVNLVLS
ncbi:DUF2970 domain-containing protein [Shewanella litorisediminis]|uniref:DUF2970 domain-containing protein n=1 Tax=Shewanella litorisediminis TaxID=1173586 RepID=A0ABX7G2M1_9GAMM|nr:DUF2970 domain-containing protein [Shewanella litorisediminis]MCL2917098.1 DUF2970 domain-containing protein [Shewanella litorisediminis]QRH01575.1 DUF2970 domain-containing protein [Shewanella litorisediminis]